MSDYESPARRVARMASGGEIKKGPSLKKIVAIALTGVIVFVTLVVWLIFYSFIAYGKKLSKKKQNNIDQLNIPTNPEAILTQDEINHLINKKD